jgi:hypothetical protein
LALLGIVSQAQRLVNQERDRERGLYFLKKVKKKGQHVVHHNCLEIK